MVFKVGNPKEKSDIELTNDTLFEIVKKQDSARFKLTLDNVSRALDMEKLANPGNLVILKGWKKAIITSDLQDDLDALKSILEQTDFIKIARKGKLAGGKKDGKIELGWFDLGDRTDLTINRPHELEVPSAMFVLKEHLPDNVRMVRGNHEQLIVDSEQGVVKELMGILTERYGDEALDIYRRLHTLLSRLPLAIKTENRGLMLHGAPYAEMDDTGVRLGVNVQEIVGNSISKDVKGSIENKDRGTGKNLIRQDTTTEGIAIYEGAGKIVGRDVVEDAMHRMDVDWLIRGHDTDIQIGDAVMFGKVLTIPKGYYAYIDLESPLNLSSPHGVLRKY